MKKSTFIIGMLFVGMTAMASCGSMPSTTNTTASTTTTSAQQTPQDRNVLGSILGGLTSAKSQDDNSGIGSIIGQIVGEVTGGNSIVGSWTYSEPSIQFESENMLAQAGGAMATRTVVNKIKPYYEKIGIKPGALAYTFNEDKTCIVTLAGKNIAGTYEYDSENHTIVITNKLGIKIMTAYATVSANNLALTFDATKLLTLVQSLGTKSTNTTLAGITALGKSIKGMKMGFMCVKK